MPSNINNQPRGILTVVKVLFGCGVFAVIPTVDAQTYYYYPSSVQAAPGVAAPAVMAAPVIVQGSGGNQVVWYWYSPQAYLPAYPVQNQQITDTQQYFQPTYQPQYAQPPVDSQVAQTSHTTSNAANAAPAATATATATAESSDPYGFLGWLNATRAAYGLPAVGYDANLSNWAAMNNGQQNARGIGHFVMGPARRQNAAMGAFASIGAMWMSSPAHRSALLDPTIRVIGIAGMGAYWTFNAY